MTAPALNRYYLIGTDEYGDPIFHASPRPNGEDQGAVEYIRADEAVAFHPLEAWDCRDEVVLLLVDYSDGQHALEDATVAITIGHNNDHNVGDGEGEGWQFAGWCWSHDHYTQGIGKPIGWLPLSQYHARARSVEVDWAAN